MNEKMPIEGEGFTMREAPRGSKTVGPSVEFRPGASSETARAQAAAEEGEAKLRGIEHQLDTALRVKHEYSETLQIESDGCFGAAGIRSIMVGGNDAPPELYGLAAQIQRKYPKYRFAFETDPERKWIKWTVSRSA